MPKLATLFVEHYIYLNILVNKSVTVYVLQTVDNLNEKIVLVTWLIFIIKHLWSFWPNNNTANECWKEREGTTDSVYSLCKQKKSMFKHWETHLWNRHVCVWELCITIQVAAFHNIRRSRKGKPPKKLPKKTQPVKKIDLIKPRLDWRF